LNYEGIGEHYGNSYPIINPQASKYRFIFETVEIADRLKFKVFLSSVSG